MPTYYSPDHEWISVEGDIATVGVTDHAQEQLGDVVFVELPEVGQSVAKGDQAGVVESVKAASEVYAPLTGEIVECNGELENNPSLVNDEAESGGWFFRVKLSDPTELESLLDADAYKELIA